MPPSADKLPAFLTLANRFYDPAFGATNARDLGAAMREWADLSADEQRFAQAHLAFLNLHAQHRTQRLLQALLEEFREGVGVLAQLGGGVGDGEVAAEAAEEPVVRLDDGEEEATSQGRDAAVDEAGEPAADVAGAA